MLYLHVSEANKLSGRRGIRRGARRPATRRTTHALAPRVPRRRSCVRPRLRSPSRRRIPGGCCERPRSPVRCTGRSEPQRRVPAGFRRRLVLEHPRRACRWPRDHPLCPRADRRAQFPSALLVPCPCAEAAPREDPCCTASGVLAGCLCRRAWHAGQGDLLDCVRVRGLSDGSANAVDPCTPISAG